MTPHPAGSATDGPCSTAAAADDPGQTAVSGDDVLLLPSPPAVDAGRVRLMSPREVAAFAHESYLSGALGWDDYCLLGFPPELHPAFDDTIGALTGERAAPDHRRDVIAEWRARLAFARRHQADDPDIIARTARILAILATPSE